MFSLIATPGRSKNLNKLKFQNLISFHKIQKCLPAADYWGQLISKNPKSTFFGEMVKV